MRLRLCRSTSIYFMSMDMLAYNYTFACACAWEVLPFHVVIWFLYYVIVKVVTTDLDTIVAIITTDLACRSVFMFLIYFLTCAVVLPHFCPVPAMYIFTPNILSVHGL